MQNGGARSSSDSGPAPRVFVAEREELGARLGEIGLQRRAPVLVLVGGADAMPGEIIADLEQLFTHAIAPMADAIGAHVVDGGTDAGVMGLMGRARAAIGGEFPLVGVVPRDALNAAPAVALRQTEPNHSHFVLVPGAQWVAAGPWLASVAEELAGGMASLTLLVNGGDVSWDDVLRSVQQRRPVVAVAGSGRAADALAAAVVGDGWDPRAREVVASGLVEVVSVADGPAALGRILARHLTGAAPAPAGDEVAEDHVALERNDLEQLIGGLELSQLQKHFLRSRWLDQVMWMDGKASHAQKRYYALRQIVIVGSIAIPLLVGLSSDRGWRILASIVGGLVAISAAIEEFFHYGERWRHYRRTAERLKSEGWRYFQRTGTYQRFPSHAQAYGEFASAVEQLLDEDVHVYLSEIAREAGQKQTEPATGELPKPALAARSTGASDGSTVRP